MIPIDWNIPINQFPQLSMFNRSKLSQVLGAQPASASNLMLSFIIFGSCVIFPDLHKNNILLQVAFPFAMSMFRNLQFCRTTSARLSVWVSWYSKAQKEVLKMVDKTTERLWIAFQGLLLQPKRKRLVKACPKSFLSTILICVGIHSQFQYVFF